MNAIGLFEAKTKFSEICDQVASRKIAVVVTRRGRPLVRIEPIPATDAPGTSVWGRRTEFVRTHGPLTEGFVLPAREKQRWRNPLAQ